jgi:hypothetical protein
MFLDQSNSQKNITTYIHQPDYESNPFVPRPRGPSNISIRFSLSRPNLPVFSFLFSLPRSPRPAPRSPRTAHIGRPGSAPAAHRSPHPTLRTGRPGTIRPGPDPTHSSSR